MTVPDTAPLPGDDETRLAALIERALDLQRTGHLDGAALDAVCAGAPDLRAAVAGALGMAADLPALHRELLRDDPMIDRVLAGRYRLLERVGAGGMGVVYRAADQTLAREVAVKLLPAWAGGGESLVQRLRREAQALAALDHPHVVPVFDTGEVADEELPFLVMPLLRGASLVDLLGAAQRAMPDGPTVDGCARPTWLDAVPEVRRTEPTWVRQVARWGMELARGLHAAHSASILHRDVKPSNGFVLADGRALLLDFGIAADASRHSEALTRSGSTLGTPWYMAPEQVMASPSAAGAGGPTPAVDVYGLGATLYHLLALRPPYDDEPARVLLRLQTDDPAPLARDDRIVPRDLQAVVERCIERDPHRRYASAGALADDLQAFLESRPVAARPLTRFARALRRLRRRPARTLAAVLAPLALVLAVGAAWLWQRERERGQLQERDRLLARVSARVVLEGWPDRGPVAAAGDDRADADEALELLDRALGLDPDHASSLLLRAALHHDGGRFADAERDLQHLAEVGGGRYLPAVVARYRQASPRLALTALDLDDAGAPDTPAAHLLAALRALRGGTADGYRAAVDLLAAAPDSDLAQRDLRTLALLQLARTSREPDQRERLFRDAYDEALRLEARLGHATARTLHVRATALLAQRRYADAAPLLEQSLALRPERAGPLNNLAVCYRRCRRWADAERAVRRALALRPDMWQARVTLSQVLSDLGRHDEAVREAEAVRIDDAGLRWQQPWRVANAHLARAFAALGDGDAAAARDSAQRADALLAEAETVGAPAGRVDNERVLAAAVARGDLTRAFTELAWRAAADPLDPAALHNLAVLAPDELDGDACAALVELLRAMVSELSPHEPGTDGGR